MHPFSDRSNSAAYDAISHIVWDWNGTLLDDVALCLSALNSVGGRRGIPPLTLERYRGIFTFPVIDYYKAAGFDFTHEPFSSPAEEWVAAYKDGVRTLARPYAGAGAVLACLARAGFRQTLLSAHEHELLVELVCHFGLDSHFSRIMGIGDIYAAGKCELGLAWLAESGVAPEAILMIGDTLHDNEVAQAMGVLCILIAEGHQSRERLREAGVPVLDSVVHVPAFLGVGDTGEDHGES